VALPANPHVFIVHNGETAGNDWTVAVI